MLFFLLKLTTVTTNDKTKREKRDTEKDTTKPPDKTRVTLKSRSPPVGVHRHRSVRKPGTKKNVMLERNTRTSDS